MLQVLIEMQPIMRFIVRLNPADMATFWVDDTYSRGAILPADRPNYASDTSSMYLMALPRNGAQKPLSQCDVLTGLKKRLWPVPESRIWKIGKEKWRCRDS
jgi:hypothetical protein